MKERPILFNAPMVRALLDGTKTQTRRIMKPQPQPTSADCPGPKGHQWPSNAVQSMVHVEQELQNKSGGWGGLAATCCPYGEIGDRLWVRETWSSDFARHYPCDRVWYLADNDRKHDIEIRSGVRGIWSPEHQEFVPFKWRPSIHMFRRDSRITLEITGVRVERLNDCSNEDAEAEGVKCNMSALSFSEHYRALWNAINGAGSWEANPWVWAIEFQRVTP